MAQTKPTAQQRKRRLYSLVMASILLIAGVVSGTPKLQNLLTPHVSAACTSAALPTTYGQVTQTAVSVPTAGAYRVWSRIKVPDGAANSYYFSFDNGCAYNVGDLSSIPANTWTWVNYQDGVPNTTIDVTLSSGQHTFTYTGKEASVQLDRVLLLVDTSCVPTGTGDNCASTDTTSPTVSIASPSNGTTVSGTVTISANASDASGVIKTDFLVDGVLKGTDTTPSYSYAWDSTTATSGQHILVAKAYDGAGNIGSSTSVSITVNNATSPSPTPAPTPVPSPTPTPTGGMDKTPPSTPVGFTATAVSTNRVDLSWQASTDNVGVHTYNIYRNEAYIKTIVVGQNASDTTYSDTTVTANTNYTYVIGALDLAVNESVRATASPNPVHTPAAGTIPTPTPTPTPAPTPKPGCPLQGDANCDNRVNALDLSMLISHDGQNYPSADFNHDGTVGAADLAILLSKWTW